MRTPAWPLYAGIVAGLTKMVELTGENEVAARFLSFWCPPRYLVSCLQASPSWRTAPFRRPGTSRSLRVEKFTFRKLVL